MIGFSFLFLFLFKSAPAAETQAISGAMIQKFQSKKEGRTAGIESALACVFFLDPLPSSRRSPFSLFRSILEVPIQIFWSQTTAVLHSSPPSSISSSILGPSASLGVSRARDHSFVGKRKTKQRNQSLRGCSVTSIRQTQVGTEPFPEMQLRILVFLLLISALWGQRLTLRAHAIEIEMVSCVILQTIHGCRCQAIRTTAPASIVPLRFDLSLSCSLDTA